MSLWSGMTHAEGQALADLLSAYRPFVGRRVRVVEGRKYLGQVGVVTWHGVDRFRGRQYGDAYSLAAQEVVGRSGYRIRIKCDDGTHCFVPANHVLVCVEASRVAS